MRPLVRRTKSQAWSASYPASAIAVDTTACTIMCRLASPRTVWLVNAKHSGGVAMARIAFVGLGNMGGPMAANLVKAGHEVAGFDLSEASVKAAIEAGVKGTVALAEAV